MAPRRSTSTRSPGSEFCAPEALFGEPRRVGKERLQLLNKASRMETVSRRMVHLNGDRHHGSPPSLPVPTQGEYRQEMLPAVAYLQTEPSC